MPRLENMALAGRVPHDRLTDDAAFGRKAIDLSTTVAFLAETPGSATIDEQKARLDPDDFVVLAGRRNFSQLGELLARGGMALKPGDHVKVFDLSCLAVSTTTLVRVLTKLLRRGISVEVIQTGIIIEPNGSGKLHALLEALDNHYRHVHGIKTHPADAAPPGRKRLLDPDQLPAVRELLAQPGSTATDVAKKLGVGRSTLFAYLERFDGQRYVERSQKAGKRGAEHRRDDGHVAEREPDEPAL